MIRARRLLVLPALGVAAALAWTAVGGISVATGQEQPVTIERAHKGSRRPTFDKPIFLLVLGGDARTGNPERTRVDSIHIVALDPKTLKGTIVGIPRDSYVNVPGHGRDKITHAGFFGGPELMVRTVEELSRCTFDYYLQTSFDGFEGPNGKRSTQGFINEIGGVHLTIPRPGITDPAIRAKVRRGLRPGLQLLNGPEALGWSRSRKDSNLRRSGDFARSEAQGTLLLALLAEARADFKKNTGSALKILGALRRNLRMNISLTESLELGLLGLRVGPRNIENIVVAGRNSSAGTASVVRITSEGRRQLVDVCSDALLDAS